MHLLIGNEFEGLLPPGKEAEKADTLCPKSHSFKLSEDIYILLLLLLLNSKAH